MALSHAKNLVEESKLIEVGFEYLRYSDKEDVAARAAYFQTALTSFSSHSFHVKFFFVYR